MTLYGRMASHGAAICDLTDETEITERVEKMMRLADAEATDVVAMLTGKETTARQPHAINVADLVVTVREAGARGMPWQGQLAELTVDLSLCKRFLEAPKYFGRRHSG